MKFWNALIFFSIVFAVYGGVNYYILRRALPVIPAGYKTTFLIIAIFIIISFILGRFMERFYLSILSDALVWVGSFYIAFMFYFLLGILLIDILRLIDGLFGIFPAIIEQNTLKASRITAGLLTVVVALTVLFGHLNTRNIKVRDLNITVPKKVESMQSLNIAVASDFHLGTLNGNGFLADIVEKINNLNPDIILLPGDIIDEDIGPVIKKNIGATLTKLKSKYGVYAVPGNHEYIGGINKALEYLRDHDITVLQDEAVLIDSTFYVAGRDDKAISNFTDGQRSSLKEVVEGLDKSKPIILMDHQPYHLENAVENGIDLQLSGHTHHGQLFPLNYITNMVYELSWGYKRKENTHFYVSCGAGGWGPPVRTGSTPEIINLKVNFLK
jgi:predicted MPP superfamily phosphohydrolase